MLRYWADFLMRSDRGPGPESFDSGQSGRAPLPVVSRLRQVRHARDCSTGLNAGRERSVLQCLRYWKSGTPGPRGAEEVYPTEVTVAAGARFSSSLTSATLAFTSRSH